MRTPNLSTAINDQGRNLNPQGLMPGSMTTTLYDASSPKEMWEGLSPGLPEAFHRWSCQVTCWQGRHQWKETVLYVSPEMVSQPPTQGHNTQEREVGPLIQLPLALGVGCYAKTQVWCWFGENEIRTIAGFQWKQERRSLHSPMS